MIHPSPSRYTAGRSDAPLALPLHRREKRRTRKGGVHGSIRGFGFFPTAPPADFGWKRELGELVLSRVQNRSSGWQSNSPVVQKPPSGWHFQLENANQKTDSAHEGPGDVDQKAVSAHGRPGDANQKTDSAHELWSSTQKNRPSEPFGEERLRGSSSLGRVLEGIPS